jgi:hypothetical protein
MHPLYRRIVLIIWLCAVIIGLNVLALWWLQARIPATPVASSQADRTPIRLVGHPAEMAPCEPTLDEKTIAERDAVIERLEGEVQRMKSAHVDDARAWKTRAEKLEQELSTLRHAVERAVSLEGPDWQAGKLMLAHALVKEKT